MKPFGTNKALPAMKSSTHVVKTLFILCKIRENLKIIYLLSDTALNFDLTGKTNKIILQKIQHIKNPELSERLKPFVGL